jgi:hypothetical protein
MTDLIERLRAQWAGRPYLPSICAEAADEIERLTGLLNDEQYIRLKADYNKGHLSHAGWLQAREQKR